MRTEYPAVASSVREARDAMFDLARSCGAGLDRADDIRLAVSEATTNVVRHAYGPSSSGTFRLVTMTGGDRMQVTVEDDGCGLNGLSPSPGLGVGLSLMNEMADHAEFRERAIGGSSVRLRFDLN